MSRPMWRVVRLVAGAAILAVLVRRLGTGPFLDAVRGVDGWSLAAATVIAVPTTLCCAWRWRLVARGLGVEVPLPVAFAAYYRSQFLNTTLPGGVVGDVHRAVRHGRDAGDTGRGLRAVAWERLAGQVVQTTMALGVLLLVASPVRSSMPAVVSGAVAAGLAVVLLGRALPRGGRSRWARTARAAAADLRGGVLARRAWPGIVLASVLAVSGHVLTFLIAARSAGATASPLQLLPLALLVLLAMGVPANVAGWGPREGVAAWVFAAAGLGAAVGVATAVAYGVLVLVASLPGAGVLVLDRREGRPVPERPYTLLSCAISLDGYLDRAAGDRLVLSNAADLDRVDAVRARCDAILVGAATIRRDNPQLLVHTPERRVRRVADGRAASPVKVTVTGGARLDPCADFFTTGSSAKLVYCASPAAADVRCRLGEVATVVDGGQPVDMGRLSEDLHARGVRRLVVEGGSSVHTQFLSAGLADELHLVVAPFFVGDSRAPRFVGDGDFPWNPDRRASLAGVQRIDDVVLLRYALSPRYDPTILEVR